MDVILLYNEKLLTIHEYYKFHVANNLENTLLRIY